MAIVILENEDTVIDAAAEQLAGLIEHPIRATGAAFVSLTGGSTPRRLYQLLADPQQPWRERIEWESVHLFWSDERHVPPWHADSNFRMASETLVSRVPIPTSQIHRLRGELEADEAAEEYERELVGGFAAAGRRGCTFDVTLLGLGKDAHIASIFPGSPLLSSPHDGRVAAPWVPHLDAHRITLTPAALLDSQHIIVLVAGNKKAPAVSAALESPTDESRYPAHVLRRPADRVEWIIDHAAARALAGPRA